MSYKSRLVTSMKDKIDWLRTQLSTKKKECITLRVELSKLRRDLLSRDHYIDALVMDGRRQGATIRELDTARRVAEEALEVLKDKHALLRAEQTLRDHRNAQHQFLSVLRRREKSLVNLPFKW